MIETYLLIITILLSAKLMLEAIKTIAIFIAIKRNIKNGSKSRKQK